MVVRYAAAMRHFASMMAFTSIATALAGQELSQTAKGMSAPALPVFDWKACPFEGCAYRRWTARKPVVVYDTWKNRRKKIADLSVGDHVNGITGVVITYRPGRIRMDSDLPESGLKKGDTVLTYAYRGEGFAAAWYNGTYDSEFDILFAKWPDGSGCGGDHCAATYVDLGKTVWWAELRLPSGRVGWVDMNASEFDGVDLLANFVAMQRPFKSLKPRRSFR